MRVELPEGYVPPEPTHPLYGYLTPEELEAYEAEERSRLGIVPEAPAPGSEEAESAVEAEQPISRWAPPGRPPAPAEIEEAPTVAGRWVPPPPPSPPPPPAAPAAEPQTEPEVEQTHRREPEVEQTHRREPVTQLQAPRAEEPAEPEYRWDAYQQKWVTSGPGPAAAPAEEPVTAPPPDHAAAAGGRGASSSWTSADGQRFRWDARAQQWIVEAASPAEPTA